MNRHVYVSHDFLDRPIEMLDPSEREVAEALGLPTTYNGHDRSVSAMRYFVDNRLPRIDVPPKQLTTALVARFLRPRVVASIPVSEIKTIQDWLRPTQVLKALAGLSIGTPPNVVMIGSNYVLLDGNHRVTAATMRGDADILVSLDDGDTE